MRRRALAALISIALLAFVGTSPVRAAFQPEQTLTDTAYTGTLFGFSTSAVGSDVLVGAPLGRVGLIPAGTAYLYTTAGALLATFPNPPPQTPAAFGHAVSAQGSRVVVGAPLTQAGLLLAGKVYVFNPATGALLLTLQSPNPLAVGEQFGAALAELGTNTLVIGAPGTQPGSGVVHLFNATTGALQQTLTNPNLAVPSFGTAVAVSGTKVLVGAPLGGPGGGAAYLFDGPSGVLLQTFANPDSDALEFGAAVTMADGKVLVGAPRRLTTDGHGSAFLFDETTGGLIATLTRPDSPSLDGFGSAVAALGTDFVIGAPQAEEAFVVWGSDAAFRDTLSSGVGPLSLEFGSAVATLGADRVLVGAPLGVGAVQIFHEQCGNGMVDAGEQCDDGNQVGGDCCARDCSYEPSGSSCDDANACTLTDACNATGACVGGNPITCTPLDECHVAGTCNSATGVCSNPPKADGTTCTDDDNPCTTDSCQSGTCTHPPISDGTTCPDDGNACTTDTCQAGSCAHPAKADGTPCPDDGNACTVDICAAGVCGGTCRENSPCSPGVDTICRFGTGGACACAPAPEPPDPASVAPPLDRSVPTDPATVLRFLHTGSTPVQAGVADGTIDARRAALVRGRVTTRDGAALAGVRASIVGHAELGWNKTRSDGRFDLVVNGGGLLTVRLAKTGYLPVDRQVEVPWQDYVSLADVVLVTKDAATTAIDLTVTTPIQVARGSVVSDADGTRQPTILVEQGTQASLVFADGTTQGTTALTVRATEYTVGSTGPAAMPATLPATSEYTHAVELGADEVESAGAVRLQFDRPVYYYVENFVGLPVGLSVPTGYYDRERAQWVAAPSGRIIKVVAITGGQADVDADGDGDADSPAELAALGITSAERTQLATLYAVNQTLWRVPIAHFTPWDCNFPWGPPPGAGDPMNPPPAAGGGPGGTGGGTPPPNCGSGSSGTSCPPAPGE